MPDATTDGPTDHSDSTPDPKDVMTAPGKEPQTPPPGSPLAKEDRNQQASGETERDDLPTPPKRPSADRSKKGQSSARSSLDPFPTPTPEQAMLVQIRSGVDHLQPLLDLLTVGSIGEGESIVARAYKLMLGLQGTLGRLEERWDRETEREDRLLATVADLQAGLAILEGQVGAIHALLVEGKDPTAQNRME